MTDDSDPIKRGCNSDDYGPTSQKFSNRDVLQCFGEEHRKHVGKIELSSKEVTAILNNRVLEDTEVTRQAVKNRLDEMTGDQLIKNKHGRSHLYARSGDLDNLFRTPEPTSGAATGGGGRPLIEDEKENKIKQHYQEQTGEELPDHVVENIEYLQVSQFNAERIERLRELESKSSHEPLALRIATSIAIMSGAAIGGIFISTLTPGTVYTKAAIGFFTALLIATLPRLIVDKLHNAVRGNHQG